MSETLIRKPWAVGTEALTFMQWATIRDLCLHERPYPTRQTTPGGAIDFVVFEDDLSVFTITVNPDGTAEKEELIGFGDGWQTTVLDHATMRWIEPTY